MISYDIIIKSYFPSLEEPFLLFLIALTKEDTSRKISEVVSGKRYNRGNVVHERDISF